MILGDAVYSLLVGVTPSEVLVYLILFLLLNYRLNRSMDCAEYCEYIEIAKFDNLAVAVVVPVRKKCFYYLTSRMNLNMHEK
ncbi:hypothetical protein K450DRAFT_243498 [Umbelopsis ramanniana AG]|uniref:Uncharacterized protein n=1 Tax=Umbelopsis ramanniana AG TaxID=1314678 RepID=A0AAD5E9C8_UMBRA|nr:uncharacterized protein K450DRAFT_243498 [Umbelopsis ramanniana AG]KAI8579247.1 hypothetical protein K450DRAFT_243498 [Umbelopsis ramanniana AG]